MRIKILIGVAIIKILMGLRYSWGLASGRLTYPCNIMSMLMYFIIKIPISV